MHYDQAQPRHVSSVGWSAGSGGQLTAALAIRCGLAELVLALLLLFDVETSGLVGP